jgi:hypothetical protein
LGRLQHQYGDGDYVEAKAFMDLYGRPDDDLKYDLERLDSTGWPIEIVLEQGG